MSNQIWDAPPVRAVAKPQIEKLHTHLKGIRIDYVWVEKAPIVRGKARAADAQKISGLAAYLAGDEGDFFVMRVTKPIWDELTPEKREALVDHELSHCGVDPNGKLFMIAHDVEDFAAVIRRHGAWYEDLEKLIAAHAEYTDEVQTNMDFDAPDGVGKEKVKKKRSSSSIVKATTANGTGAKRGPKPKQSADDTMPALPPARALPAPQVPAAH